MNKIMKYILLFAVIISVAACGKKNEKKTADVEKSTKNADE